MQVRDDSLWQELVKDLRNTEQGQHFFEFLTEWVEAAEQVLSQDTAPNPAEALRLTLDLVENSLDRKDIWVVGQCLVIFCMHWKHGEKLAENFTQLEMRLVEDITVAKIAQLQASAEEAIVAAE